MEDGIVSWVAWRADGGFDEKLDGMKEGPAPGPQMVDLMGGREVLLQAGAWVSSMGGGLGGVRVGDGIG